MGIWLQTTEDTAVKRCWSSWERLEDGGSSDVWPTQVKRVDMSVKEAQAEIPRSQCPWNMRLNELRKCLVVPCSIPSLCHGAWWPSGFVAFSVWMNEWETRGWAEVVWIYRRDHLSDSDKRQNRDFPGGPVAKTLCSQSTGTWVWSLVRELEPTCWN